MGAAGSASAPAEMRNARDRSSAAYAPRKPPHFPVSAARAPEAVRLREQSGAAPPTTRPESTDAPTSTHPEGPRTADRSAPGRSTSTAVNSPESRSNPGTWARPGTAAEPQAARATPARRRARRIPPSCTRSAPARAPSRDRMWGMRLSIATKVFLGFAAVLAMSGAVSLFGIVQMHRIGQGLALVSSGYFPVTKIAGSLEAFQKERERSTDRLLEEQDPRQRKALFTLDRTYFARIADERLARAKEQIQTARAGASPRDREALDKLDARLSLLAARLAEQDQAAAALPPLFAAADAQRRSLDSLPQAQDAIARLRTSERRVEHEIKTLLNVIQE